MLNDEIMMTTPLPSHKISEISTKDELPPVTTHDVPGATSRLSMLQKGNYSANRSQRFAFFFSGCSHLSGTWVMGKLILHRLPPLARCYHINFLCSSRAGHPALS